jgi:threonine/homoserine/homoserine lactone efflux protein
MNLSANTLINMDIILKGIFTGLFLSVFVGATFFMLIETSMTRGFKAAMWFDSGVVLCDATIIFIVYFFEAWINNTLVDNAYFNVVGGIMFIGFGVNYIFSRQRNDSLHQLKSRNLMLFMNGFFINLMNPSVVLFWLGTMALTLSEFKFTGRQTFIYYSSALAVMVLFDIAKAYFAYKISSFINAKVLRIVYIFSGILMIGLGIYFIFK